MNVNNMVSVRKMMRQVNKTLAALLLSLCAMQGMSQTDVGQFRNPPMEFRPVPLWFWNDTPVEEGELRSQFENMVQADRYGGCAILPFGGGFKPKYTSEDYFAIYGKAIEEARSRGAFMSLYDEYGFPSGSMGAINGDGTPRFMNKHPEASIKRLDKVEFAVRPGAVCDQTLPEGKLMALVAMDTLTRERVSLREHVQGGRLTWTVPQQGAWKVMCFVCVKDGDPNVDYLSPEAVALFVKETHEEYYKRFPQDFGKTIRTTFFDEPTLYRAAGRIWTNAFNEKFAKAYGFAPDLFYPALWYDIGPETAAARNYLFGFRARLYAEGFMKTIQDWAQAHGIQSTGHQDQEEILNPVSVSGDLMLCGKYMGMPGIDKIGGGRPTEDFYKVVSSSANNWDKTLVMSETYGAMGNISVETMYTIAMEQYTKGINHLIPHAVWYNDRSVTFLPELSYRNPLYNRELPAFNTFLARLNYMLARPGRHVADIAMLYPIESLQAEHRFDGPKGAYEGGVDIPNTDYALVSRILTDSVCRDFTYLHPEVLNGKCRVRGNRLVMKNKVNREAFGILVVPGMKTISVTNMKRIQDFYRAGGQVLFTTQLPQHAVEAGQDQLVRDAVREMLTPSESVSGRAVFEPEPSARTIAAFLAACDMVPDVAFREGCLLNYIHKEMKKASVYYFANLGDEASCTRIALKGKLTPMLYDPHTGETQPVEFSHEKQDGVVTTVFTLPLQRKSSAFISCK